MTLKQIEAFYWAATLGNFAIAAERLHVTQSSLSKRIAELEHSLQRSLFDRTRKNATLTEAGEALMPQCRSLLNMAEAIRGDATMQTESRALSGVCKFGISELSASTWLPRFVDRVRSIHPLLVLQPQICLTRELERFVQRGELDFAVIAGSPLSPSVAAQPVAEVQFSWAASPRLARAGQILHAEEFDHLNILSHPSDSGLALAFNSWLTVHNLKVRRVIVCNSLTTIISLTVADMGISFLPTRYIQPLIERGHLVLLGSRPELPSLSYNFIWLRDDIRPVPMMMKKLLLPEVDFSIPNSLWV